MSTQRRIGAFALTFAVVMIGGAALAAVGGPPNPPSAQTAISFGPAQALQTKTTVGAPASALWMTPADPQPRGGLPTTDAAPKSDVRPLADVPTPKPYDDSPPRLKILEPENGATVHTDHVRVLGETEPGAVVTYGDRRAEVDDRGLWWILVRLEPGKNILVFNATDSSGNSTQARTSVYYEPPWRFTAHQRYEVVDGDPVVNYYWGTSKPGAEVTVESEYGRGRTTANDDGKWELRVEFPTAPCNEPFRVVAASGDHRQEFKMKRACPVDWRFTAHQRYEVVDGDPVVNYYWGTSKPGAEVTVESEYGRGRTTANDDGKWELRVEFPTAPCNEPFRVVAASGDHRQEFKMKRACPVDWRFTAHQRYEVVDGDPVVNYYWGTSKPGAEVTVESEYGRGRTTANDDGKWELRVEFPTAPCNEPFRVVAASGDHRQEFKMKRACPVDWRFTAHQRYEVVDGDPVVNYYWGTSKPGAEVTVESEYGRGRTTANDDGKWELRVEFPTAPCNEPFRVVAASGDHRQEFKMKRACPVDIAFTAHQKYGECGEPIPFDIFFGSADPGALISVESPYGGGEAEADESGHWELKVEFPDAPEGEAFEVVVETSDGHRKVFSFVNNGADK